jgi:signal transduction histidine kinase
VHELLLSSPDLKTIGEELRTRGHWTGEIVQTRRDGQKIIVESRMVVVTDMQGRQIVVQADRPITERKESERLLRNLADDLTTADRNKDEFLAMLAHELRNPLAPLRNIASILKSDTVGDEQKSRAADMMERQVQTMARLIDDLLDASRMTLSLIELRKEHIEVASPVRHAVEQQEDSIRAKNQKLRLELPDRPLYVEADEVRLEQIVGNLLNNACKYTRSNGEICVKVERIAGDSAAAKGVQARDQVAIRVTDNGIGIDADKLPRVFDLFMRATRSIDQRYGGLGLGLTLVRKLVELHGGAVEAHSAGRGKGSEFVVRLPLLADFEVRETPAPRNEEPERSVCKRILVVDDQPDSRDSTAITLRMAGHEVAIAESGSHALALALEFKPEVALVDIGMPEMDGYELARRLRESLDGTLRVIAVSGYGDAVARERAKDAGFDDYLVKPAGFEDMLRVIS